MNNNIYTIGHSNISIDEFIIILKQYKINILVDVRGTPYSKWVPHFNKNNLLNSCETSNIKYIHKENLGSKYIYPMLEPDDNLKELLQKICISTNKYNICLMSEGWDFENCHRTILANFMNKLFGTQTLHINSKTKKLFPKKAIQNSLFL